MSYYFSLARLILSMTPIDDIYEGLSSLIDFVYHFLIADSKILSASMAYYFSLARLVLSIGSIDKFDSPVLVLRYVKKRQKYGKNRFKFILGIAPPPTQK